MWHLVSTILLSSSSHSLKLDVVLHLAGAALDYLMIAKMAFASRTSIGCCLQNKLLLCMRGCAQLPQSALCIAGGRRKPVPKVTITELNRRLTGEPKDFQEVMQQARRVSQGGEA